MSANAHTAVMTDLEQRIQDGRQLSAPRPRINRIMEDRFYGQKPRVDIQRAVDAQSRRTLSPLQPLAGISSLSFSHILRPKS